MLAEVVIEYANQDDLPFLERNDSHLPVRALRDKVARREVLIARQDVLPVGWLRFGLFWDSIPFMNMLFLQESSRGQGIGRLLVLFWEEEMKQCGHRLVLTSTQADEDAQHFYRKLGYKDIGGFVLPNEPLEIILLKSLTA